MTARALVFVGAFVVGGACSTSGTSSPPSGGSMSCKTNASCAADHVCYFATGTSCGGAGGVCVARLGATCSQNAGGGCPCLGVAPNECAGGAMGTACRGGDQPEQCWFCYVPR